MTQTAKATRKGKLTGWIMFLSVLLVFSLAATPGHEAFSVAVDRALVAIRLSLVIAISVLVVQQRLTPGARVSGGVLRRMREWFYDQE